MKFTPTLFHFENPGHRHPRTEGVCALRIDQVGGEGAAGRWMPGGGGCGARGNEKRLGRRRVHRKMY